MLSPDQLRSLTDPTTNEANLTQDELNQRLQAFQQEGSGPGTIDKDTVQRAIGQALVADGYQGDITPEGKGTVPGQIADWVVQNGRYPSSQELKTIIGGAAKSPFPDFNTWAHNKNISLNRTNQSGFQQGYNQEKQAYEANTPQAIPPTLLNFTNNQDRINQLSSLVDSMAKTPDVKGDTARIQGLLDAQGQATTNKNDLNSYISGLPDALKGQEDQMLNAYDQSNQQQFQDVLAPQALASANARGALFSGDVGDLLSSGAGNIQAGRENLQSQIQQQDNQFYFNAAYQNTLTQQLQGQSNYAQFLQGEQSRVLGNNANQFQTNQANLNNVNAQNVSQMQYQNQLRNYQKQLQMQQDQQNASRQAGLIGGIGQAIGGIGMTAIGVSTSNPYLIAGGASNIVGGASQVGGH